MNQHNIDKLMKLAAGGEVIFIGPYSNASRFVDHFKVHESKGALAILDNGNEIPLSVDTTSLKDFALTLRIPE